MTVPSHVRVCGLGWIIGLTCLGGLLAIPAYRSPWSVQVPVSRTSAGTLTGAVQPLSTPFVSFAAIRFPDPQPDSAIAFSLLAGSSRVFAGRLARAGPRDFRTAFAPQQLPPGETIRVVLDSDAASGEVTIGHDGRALAVRAIRFWWPWLSLVFLAGAGLILARQTWPAQLAMVSTVGAAARLPRAFLLLLGAAVAVRAILVAGGGQYFDFDEVRYADSARAFEFLATGNVGAAADAIVRAPDHSGFRIIGLIPALFHGASAWLAGRPISEVRHYSGEWLPALLLSLASVCSIALTYAIARRMEASEQESFLAALLMWASASMLMYARHLVPYDASLALLLLALWIGLGNDDGIWRPYVAGFVAGLAFLTYAGHWLGAALVGVLPLLNRIRSPLRFASGGAAFGAGLLTLPALLVAGGAAAGIDVIREMGQFADTVVNGDFSEGWSLPWVAMWHGDGALVILYATGAALAVFHRRRGRVWLTGLLLMYAGLVVGSNVLQRFVVYDRLSRQMLPLLSLAAACGLASVGAGRLLRGAQGMLLTGAVVVIGIVNAWPHLTQRFPRDFALAAIDQQGIGSVSMGTILADMNLATAFTFLPIDVARFDPATPSAYVLFNVTDLWVEQRIERLSPPPAGRVLQRAAHPRQHPSRQYHGYTPRQREFLRSVDVSMQLIQTSSAGPNQP